MDKRLLVGLSQKVICSFLLILDFLVDGAAWRTALSNPGSGFKYPDFLLSDEPVSGVKAAKKSKL